MLLRRLWTVTKYVKEHLPSFLAVAHHDIGQVNERVMFGELRVLLFVFGACMAGWEWMCE